MRYRGAVEDLEKMGHLRLLQILNEEDYIRFIPRKIFTIGSFTGLTILNLIFNQGRFYRKAGIELSLSDEEIDITHSKVSGASNHLCKNSSLYHTKDLNASLTFCRYPIAL